MAKPATIWQQQAQQGALTGLLIGVLAMLAALVLIAMGDRRAIESRLGMSRAAMCAYYVFGGTCLGALAGLLSAWLRGRWGRIAVGVIITAVGTVILLPLIAGPMTHWGGSELLTVVLVAGVLGPPMARSHASPDQAQDI
jgi:hypothetical protein